MESISIYETFRICPGQKKRTRIYTFLIKDTLSMGLLLIELDYGSLISRIACRCRTRRLSTAVCVVYNYRKISESSVNCARRHTRLSFIKSRGYRVVPQQCQVRRLLSYSIVVASGTGRII